MNLVTTSESALELVSCCPVCGGEAIHNRYSDLQDFVEDFPGQWCLDRCGQCECLFANPRLKPEQVAAAYQSYYTHQSPVEASLIDNGSSYIWRLANGYLNHRYGLMRTPASEQGKYLVPLLFPLRQQLDFFMRHLPDKPGRLLDVGCGNGRFLLRARDAGWSVMGVEPDGKAVAAVRKAGIEVVEGFLDTLHVSEPFDVVTVSHVIEHVHEPRQFVRSLYDNLKPGGLVWLATPNSKSVGHAWYGAAWRGLEPPRHMVVFSARAVERVLEEAGFVDIEFKLRGRGARYILKTSEQIAIRIGRRRAIALPVTLVDMLASLLPTASEEIVVVARRPA